MDAARRRIHVPSTGVPVDPSPEPSGGARPAPPRVEDRDALGQYLRDISAFPLLSRDDEVRLGRLAAAGDRDAIDALVHANLRFVVAVAKRYRGRGVPVADLVSEGNVGLIRAARRFDPEQGVRFISYAVWWIRQAVLQALAEQGRVVRVPLNRAGALHRVGRRAAALSQALGRDPTAAEIAEETGIPLDEVEVLLSTARAPVSLDSPVGDAGGGGTLVDRLADEAGEAPDARLLESARTDAIEASLAALKTREANVLRLYYGLGGEEPRTLEEIGALLGLTRERVRQIKEKGLARLRHAARARALEPFVR